MLSPMSVHCDPSARADVFTSPLMGVFEHRHDGSGVVVKREIPICKEDVPPNLSMRLPSAHHPHMHSVEVTSPFAVSTRWEIFSRV